MRRRRRAKPSPRRLDAPTALPCSRVSGARRAIKCWQRFPWRHCLVACSRSRSSRAAWSGDPLSTDSRFPISRVSCTAEGWFSRVPVIIGSNKDDGFTFVDRSFPSRHRSVAIRTIGAGGIRDGCGGDTALVSGSSVPHREGCAESCHDSDVEFVCEARRLARALRREGAPSLRLLLRVRDRRGQSGPRAAWLGDEPRVREQFRRAVKSRADARPISCSSTP